MPLTTESLSNLCIDASFPNLQAYFLQSIPKGCFPDFLYHYTKSDILPLICGRRGRMLATNGCYFKDYHEIVYGATRFLDALTKVNQVPQSIILKIKEALYTLHDGKCTAMPWITSFSCRNDSARLWHDYTSRDGGYCIVFRYKGLLEFVKWFMARRGYYSESNEGSLFIMPCIYEGKHDIEKYLQAYVKDISNNLAHEHNANYVLAHAIVAGVCVKKAMYQFEHEWRMILIPSARQLITDDVLILNNKPRLSLGFEKWLDDMRRLIAGILISPHGNHQKLRANAKKLVRDYIVQNNNSRPKIEISGLPTEYDNLITYWDKSQQAYELHT